jgi:glycosyltransferase involved in cell wall biosynthesis
LSSVSRIPVVQLIDGFATEEHAGGAALFGIQLARHLDREIFAPYICGLWQYRTRSERRWRAQLEREGIGTTILIERPTQIEADMVRAAALLAQLLSRLQPRIINSHFERGDLLSLWSKVIHPTHPRIVRTMHADQQWQTRPWLGRLLNLLAFPWLFDAEVAISKATQQVMDRRIAARLRGRQAIQIYNGISSSLLRQPATSTPADRDRPKDGPRAVIIGRLKPQKGHQYLIEAAAQLLRDIPDLKVWILGAGSLLDELQAQVRELGTTDAVLFLGERDDVPQILQQADLLVSASIWEGFPTVILEAMAARVPVIATDVSGSRELVRNGETGLLVPAAQPKSLAAAIRTMIENPGEARRMAENAWRQVHRYTLEEIGATYTELYRRLIHT